MDRRRNKRLSPQQVEDIVQEYLEHFERESDEGKTRERKARKTAARRKSLGRSKTKVGAGASADKAADTAAARSPVTAADAADAGEKAPALRHATSTEAAAAAAATQTQEEQEQLLPSRSNPSRGTSDRRQQPSSTFTDTPAVQGYQECVGVYGFGFPLAELSEWSDAQSLAFRATGSSGVVGWVVGV